LQNPFVGAPNGLQLYDFPAFDTAVAAILWFFSLFTHNTALIINVFYLLTFPLITVASLYVLRQFNLSFVPALFCSLLYAFLPYHFLRNESHLILSAYYVIPLAVLVLLWITTEELLPRTRKFILSVLICILLGLSGVYYPFFFCYLLLIAGAIGSLKLRRLRPLATALVLIGITTAIVAVSLSPSLINRYRSGDAGIMARHPGDAEVHGLKIAQLVLPITHHRFPLFDKLKEHYNQFTPVSDGVTASLGIVGTIGFLGLVAQLLHRKELIQNARGLLRDLSLLNLFALLLGLAGGLGYLVAIFVWSGIRSYNRISVFIAFFSLMAVGIGLEHLFRRSRKSLTIFYLALALAFVVAFLDQTTPAFIQDYGETKARFVNDQQFVSAIEAGVPPGAMIFQLPYVPFPEEPPVNRMQDYDHFRGYLHSKTLRWSYGAVRNREGDRVQKVVAGLPTDEFVESLAFANFTGIYLDRDGYEDHGAAKEAELSRIVQSKPLISSNGRWVFFNITDFARNLRTKYSDAEWEENKQLSFHPVLEDWSGGFFQLESRPGKTWRWCSSEGELHLRNISHRPRMIKLEMAFATGYEQFDDFHISGLISEQLKVNSTPSFYSKTITVPPGESVITFRSTARRVEAPLDTRYLVFRIEDFKMTELQ
jgi:phosphoglycerol transferase